MESAAKRRRLDISYREFEDDEESGYESTGDEWKLSGGEAQESVEWTDSDDDVNAQRVVLERRRMGNGGKAVSRRRRLGGGGEMVGVEEEDGKDGHLKGVKPKEKRQTNILEVRDRTYSCYWACGAKFSTINETNKHVLETHADTALVKYKCPHPECGLVFPHPRFIFDHYKTHSEIPSDGFRFVDVGDVNEFGESSSEDGASEHRRGGEGYPCLVKGCDAWFNLLDSRKRHMQTVHARETSKGEMKLKCKHEGCGKSYNRLDNLRRHLHRSHGEEIPKLRPAKPVSDERFVCGIGGCELEYSTMTALYTHRSRKHRGWRKLTESSEREAEEGGNVEKEFPCGVDGCDLVFPSLRSMRIHEARGHRGEKRLKCPKRGCGECFEFRCELKKHNIVSHPPPKPTVWEGDWPLMCDGRNCDAVFVEFSRWKNHIQSQHPDLPVPDMPRYSRKRRSYVWGESECELSDGDQSGKDTKEIDQSNDAICAGIGSGGDQLDKEAEEEMDQSDGDLSDDENLGIEGNSELSEVFIPSPFYRGPVSPRLHLPSVLADAARRNDSGKTETKTVNETREGHVLGIVSRSPIAPTLKSLRMSSRLANARKQECTGVNSEMGEIGNGEDVGSESQCVSVYVEAPNVRTPAPRKSARDRKSQSEKVASKAHTPFSVPNVPVFSLSTVKPKTSLVGPESSSKYVLNRQVVRCGVNGCRLQFTTAHSLEFHRKLWH